MLCLTYCIGSNISTILLIFKHLQFARRLVIYVNVLVTLIDIHILYDNTFYTLGCTSHTIN